MKLRWGICGAGKISNDFCSALKTLPDTEHEIVAIAARSVDRAKEFGDKFGARKAYGSYDELAADSEIDIAYVGVIHTRHIPLTKQMLSAGKHVLCEKPLCFSLKQAQEIIQLAKDKNKLLMEATWSRAFPIYRKIREEIDSGSLGDIQLVTASFCLPIIHVERLKNIDLGGGSLLDIGMYTVQFANWVFKNEKPVSIKAVATLSENGVDEDGCIIMSYKNGAKASLTYTAKCLAINGAYVFGNKGSIQIKDNFWCPTEATLPSGKATNDVPQGPSPYFFVNSGGLSYQADLIRKSIMAGKIECPVMTFADTEMMYYIMDEVRQQIGLKYEEASWT
ncbi:hypothetical protein FSP39_000946 [Pinctada imbricata]|uniref:Trans-1,2-dihydrobenzene-1,2-diol dehydrogenase n=1 Tax=Pinctada imbricata TaxID=66713 RepID=A0AA88YC86_PINIB|nr:hypothetical protein FSP39_000946 [Pinctada imbricata]